MADHNLKIDKGGHNNLTRWKQFGGEIDRPAPPSPRMDETSYMTGKWRCSKCGSLNSMEGDNVCSKQHGF